MQGWYEKIHRCHSTFLAELHLCIFTNSDIYISYYAF